jgi:PadR family transcriptional regulator, regulatory protein PadR
MDTKREMMQSFWQGLVRFFILHQAGHSPVYGIRLKKQLHEWGYDLSPGSLYPMLHALEKALLLHSRVKIFKGRARKYYEITAQGRTVLAALQEELAEIMGKMLPASLPPCTGDPPPKEPRATPNNPRR